MVKVVNGCALIGTLVVAAAALFHDQAAIMVSHRLAILVYRKDDRVSYSWYEFRVAMVRRESQQSPRTRSENSLTRYKTMIPTLTVIGKVCTTLSTVVRHFTLV